MPNEIRLIQYNDAWLMNDLIFPSYLEEAVYEKQIKHNYQECGVLRLVKLKPGLLASSIAGSHREGSFAATDDQRDTKPYRYNARCNETTQTAQRVQPQWKRNKYEAEEDKPQKVPPHISICLLQLLGGHQGLSGLEGFL